MVKSPKPVSRETISETEAVSQTIIMADPSPPHCGKCAAWRPEPTGIFGGCAKSGKTTSHYGESRFVHYTPDGAVCSAFQPKE